MAFKSGCDHEPLKVTDKETALAMMSTLKADSGLFSIEGARYTAPVDPHDWKLVPGGMVARLADGSKQRATYLIETVGGRKERRHLERCAGCDYCDERGFPKTKVG